MKYYLRKSCLGCLPYGLKRSIKIKFCQVAKLSGLKETTSASARDTTLVVRRVLYVYLPLKPYSASKKAICRSTNEVNKLDPLFGPLPLLYISSHIVSFYLELHPKSYLSSPIRSGGWLEIPPGCLSGGQFIGFQNLLDYWWSRLYWVHKVEERQNCSVPMNMSSVIVNKFRYYDLIKNGIRQKIRYS